jgi:hypothetical protein
MSSKSRSISVSIWSDPWVEDLNLYEKLLFIYLLTNDKTNLLGIYEHSFKRISFETGIEIEKVNLIFDRFQKDNKITYSNGHVIIHNFLDHQNMNPSMIKSSANDYKRLQTDIKSHPEVVKILGKLNALILSNDAGKTILHTPCVQGDHRVASSCVQIEVEVEEEIEIEREVEDEEETRVRANSSSTAEKNILIDSKKEKEKDSHRALRELYAVRKQKPVNELAAEYLDNQIVTDVVMKDYGIDKYLLEDWMNVFVRHKIRGSDTTDTLDNFARHFRSWMRKIDLDKGPIHYQNSLSDGKSDSKSTAKPKPVNGVRQLAEELTGILGSKQ